MSKKVVNTSNNDDDSTDKINNDNMPGSYYYSGLMLQMESTIDLNQNIEVVLKISRTCV